jgi:hypothetical protein
MSAIAGQSWNLQKDGPVSRLPQAPAVGESLMREKIAAIRDTMIVLSLQLVFRAFTLLRRWNY